MNATPRWFKPVVIAALVWNVLGCMALGADLALSPADIAAMPEAQRALYEARPAWAVAATAIAVFGGVLGCIGLLLRRSWAVPVLAASLAGIVVQDIALFVLVDGASLAGPVAVVLQGVVLAIGAALLVLARKARSRGWLA